MKQKNPTLTPAQQWQILTSTCDTFSWGNPYPNQSYGWGRLNCLRAIDATPSGIEEKEVELPQSRPLSLSVWPNPMRTGCEIRWQDRDSRPIRIGLYDAAGRRVCSLSGQGEVAWDGRGENGADLASGVYFAVPERGEGSAVRIVVVK
jgi:hypothetical protein